MFRLKLGIAIYEYWFENRKWVWLVDTVIWYTNERKGMKGYLCVILCNFLQTKNVDRITQQPKSSNIKCTFEIEWRVSIMVGGFNFNFYYYI